MSETQDRLITPVGIIGSKAVLFTPVLPRNAKPTDKPQFFLRLLFTPADLKTPAWAKVSEALIAAGRAKWKKFDAMAKEGALKLPFRKDIETKGYDADVFAVYLNIAGYEDSPPAIIGPDGKPFADQTKFYPGARARASVRLSIFDREDNKGISVKLAAVQWAGEGERMSRGGGSDGSEFDKIEGVATDSDGGSDDLMSLVA